MLELYYLYKLYAIANDAQRMRWHFGQKCEPRFMKLSRTMVVPQRSHGLPCRP